LRGAELAGYGLIVRFEGDLKVRICGVCLEAKFLWFEEGFC